MQFAPTAQQQACIEAVGAHDMVRITAAAGSGKTSTLKLVSAAYNVPSLYLCFNKSTATEAEGSFPDNVEARTSHSIAYGFVGHKLQAKLQRPKGGYVNVAVTGSEIEKFFKIGPIQFDQDTVVSGGWLGMMARQTVSRFEQSADSSITQGHVPHGELAERLNDNVDYIRHAKKIIFKVAEKLWEERCDEKSRVLITPDTYLKLYQLSKPILRGKKCGVPQILYVDEAQDCSPCVLDIIHTQRGHMKIVAVGDARQAIYSFRGAVNAMKILTGEERFLTKSFRFGQAVADVATSVLQRDMVIEGNEAITSQAGLVGLVKRSQPYTRLFRTNANLLGEAIADIKKGRSINIEIDTKDFVKFLESAQALYTGEKKKVKHDRLLAYKSYDELLTESKHDAELRRVVKVLKDGLVDDWIDTLKHHENVYEPHITYTTCHKSKGRQFPQVIVESDFKSGYNQDGEWVGLSTEEQNLLYVAVTRAQYVLEYNQTTQEYIDQETIA